MTADRAPARGQGPASAEAGATAKRSRGVYRRQLTASRPGSGAFGIEARRAAAVILEVLAGVRTPATAATALEIRLPRYYLLEERAIQGLISACEPRPRGRTVSTDRRLVRLERELAASQRELARHQALARNTQRAFGLAPPPSPSGTKPRGAKEPSPGSKRRRRKPSVRPLRAARLLNGSSPGGQPPSAVKETAGAPHVLGSAGGGGRPAATDASRSPAQADHGGSHHAGRPKTDEHR